MTDHNSTERRIWQKVRQRLSGEDIRLGRHWSYNIYNDPKRLAFVLSRYKFAAKMSACKGKHILELGCSEGIGAPILGEFAAGYTGVDMDAEAIEAARVNWTDDKFTFIADDFLGKEFGVFDSLVCLDVIEHIDRSQEQCFLETIYRNLSEDGICIIGTPNITASEYASCASKEGHVNMFDADRLFETLKKIFFNVFLFGQNDEVVHTGFSPMAHFLIGLGCYKREKML